MLKSKSRKPRNIKGQPSRRTPTQLKRQLGVVDDWNQAVAHLDTDHFYVEWCKLRLARGDKHERALAAATMTWVGAGDPGGFSVGLYQCWHACYLIGVGMRALATAPSSALL